jgi:sugar O-acyltransferase (sialic acid O-acetyltransferase NeuD family)
MRKFCILGQSNYAISIILEGLQTNYPDHDFSVDIVSNISVEENDSLPWPYKISGIVTYERMLYDWTPGGYSSYFVGSIGKSRRQIVRYFEAQFGIGATEYGNLIYPSSVLASTIEHGNGLHIGPLVVLAPYVQLGEFVVINRHVSIGHHTILDNFVTINPGVNIAGCCHLEEGVTIGAGTTIIDNIKIGKNTLIGAGSVVTRSLPPGVVAYGVPAKIISTIGA